MSESDARPPEGVLSPEKVLFVDDEKNVLAAIHRQLRKEFNLIPALGGENALQMLETHRPAVVVCDMRMPGMSGVDTLAEFERRSPDTVRIMLTGNSDQETAVDAINRGKIFRFLTKPCPEPVLRQALIDALRQHQLVVAEKTLLQQTLTGSVRALVDVLSLVVPVEFDKSNRARAWAQPLAAAIGLNGGWELEMATMLYPLGLVAVPGELLEKARVSPNQISTKEAAMISRAPASARRLLMHIPRLESVAEAISMQDCSYTASSAAESGPSGVRIPVLARALRVLKDLAAETTTEVPTDSAVAKLLARSELYDLRILNAAKKLWGIGPGLSEATIAASVKSRVKVMLDSLLPADLLLTPIKLQSGKLLLSDGVRITAAQIERLRNLRQLEAIQEPIEIERQVPLAA